MIFAYKLYMLNSKTIALAIGQRAFTCSHVKLTEMLTTASHCAINNVGPKQHSLSFVICKTHG